MFRFAHPELLYVLFIIPLLVGLFWYSGWKKKNLLNDFAEKKLQKVILPTLSNAKARLKMILLTLSFVFLIVAMSNPQIGTKVKEVKQSGIDVYIILDVSLSMQAQDIKPSRLENAKFQISNLINKLRGDRIGLIVFAGAAYVQFPLTTDYSAANLFLSAVSVKSVPQPGTAIAEALNLATNSFDKKSETKRAIVLITDGEDHEGDYLKAVDNAVLSNIQIYTIGIGSNDGVPIPTYSNNGNQIGYKKDRKGKVVLTKLGVLTLEDIAKKGNGKFYLASNNQNELDKIYNQLSSIKKTEFGVKKITDYEDRFYYFLLGALLLLIIEFFITKNSSKLFAGLGKKLKLK